MNFARLSVVSAIWVSLVSGGVARLSCLVSLFCYLTGGTFHSSSRKRFSPVTDF